jgi:hypothetical protein
LDAHKRGKFFVRRHNALHLKVAEEIERRSGNRLTEVAEVLAHHYSQTGHAVKAFAYLSMAGASKQRTGSSLFLL